MSFSEPIYSSIILTESSSTSNLRLEENNYTPSSFQPRKCIRSRLITCLFASLGLVFLGVSAGFYFSLVTKGNIQAFTFPLFSSSVLISTKCEFQSHQESSFPCCEKVNCECKELIEQNYTTTYPSCFTSLQNSVSVPKCTDNLFKRCNTECKTCSTTYEYPCFIPSYNNTQKEGKENGICYYIDYSDCECQKSIKVHHSLCEIDCGNSCLFIESSFLFNLSSSSSFFVKERNISYNCGNQGNAPYCIWKWKQDHKLYKSTSCWYDSSHDQIYFTFPSTLPYLVSSTTNTILLVVLLLACFAGLLFLMSLFSYKMDNQMMKVHQLPPLY